MNLPKVFEEKMKDLLGSEYEAYTACYDEPRHYGLRVNTAKISVEDFLKIAPWPLEPVPWIHNRRNTGTSHYRQCTSCQ